MGKLLVTREAAEYTGMSPSYMLNQAKAGNIPFVQPSPKKFFFDVADLDIWMSKWKRRNPLTGAGAA